MPIPEAIKSLTDEEGLTFLELLSHNLTIGVRMAASRLEPMGSRSEQQTRLAMYWVNEVIHNVVQLTRELRLDRELWTRDQTWKWIYIWHGYDHGSDEIEWAIQRSIEELLRMRHAE